MKSEKIGSTLNLVLAISLIVLALLCVQYYFKSKELRNFQTTVAAYQNRKAQLNMLVADLAEYGKTHPAIHPLLESAGIPVVKPNPATPSSATKSSK